MSKNTALLSVLALIIVVLFIATRIASLRPNSASQKTDPQESHILNRDIDINDVINDPPVYSDLTLTLEGKINDWVTKNAFTITPVKTSFGGGGKSLPVISKDNYKLPDDTPENILALGEIANVRVRGKIVILDRATLEQQWGIDLNDNEIDRWNKSPVMLLDKIEKI